MKHWVGHSWQALILFTVVVPAGVKVLAGDDVGYLDTILLAVGILIIRLVIKLDDQVDALARRGKVWEGDLQEQGLIRCRDILNALRAQGNLVAVDILLREVELIEGRFKVAVDTGDLAFSGQDLEAREHILNHLGNGERIRFVHFFRDNTKYFGENEGWVRFYSQIKKATQYKDVVVRRLFVAKTAQETLDPVSVKLVDYHRATPGYEYGVITEKQFEQNRNESRRLPSSFHDFGIYGQEYVFFWSEDGKQGTLSHNKTRIRALTAFFDTLWERSTERSFE